MLSPVFSLTVTEDNNNEYNTSLNWLFKDFYYYYFGRLSFIHSFIHIRSLAPSLSLSFFNFSGLV